MNTSKIDAVYDELAVIQLVNRYTDTVNRKDWDALGNLFCADGVWDAGGPEAAPLTFLFTGREQVVAGIRGLVTQLDFHVQTNHAVVVNVNGDRATASCTLHELARLPGGTAGQMIYGMYTDDIVRERDNQWRFAKRKFRFSYIEEITVPGKAMKLK